MNQLEEWFRVKMARSKGSINTPVATEGKLIRIYGGRSDFAYVSLYLEPAEEFSYHNQAQWPDDEERCNNAVMEGVLDALIYSFNKHWNINVKVTLKEIKFHPVDSNPNAFYRASRSAIEKLINEHKNEKQIFSSHV